METRELVCNKCYEPLSCNSCNINAVVKKEKGVDVLLASEMIRYGMEDNYDAAYLISGDGDFSPAVSIIRNILKKKVFNVVPHGTRAYSLKQSCNATIYLNADWVDGIRE